MKKLVLMLLALALTTCLFSCGGGGTEPCDVHVDENGDKVCDVCSETIETNEPETSEVKLIENGIPTFQIVFDQSLPTTVRLEVNNLAKALKKATDTEVAIKLDNHDGKSDCEILIGNITSRGEQFEFDYHELGPKGTAIKIVENKIILLAGSEDAFIDLIESFAEDVLKLDGNELTEENVTATLDDCFYEPQTEYRIKSISVGDVVMDKHSIIINKANLAALAAAQNIQSNFYTFTGYWLPIVDENAATSTENAIVIKVLEKDGVSDGYKLYVSGSSIVFEIMYENKLAEKVNDFLAPIKLKTGDVKLTASTVNKTENIRVITYAGYFKDKGETIDNTGSVDVSTQIKEVHAYANEHGHDVKAGSGTYLIKDGNGGNPIVIQTNVDWTGATFIVDDRNIEANSPAAEAPIIQVQTSKSSTSYGLNHDYVKTINAQIEEAGGVDFRELTNFFGLSFGEKVMLRVRNKNHKVYIRYGGNANSGADQTEMILLDAEGNIIEDTGFMLDYNEVTDFTVYRVNADAPITLEGGTFITRANRAACSYSTGFTRQISIQRSNVTIKGLTHKITDEGDVGSCYSSFLGARYAYNTLIEGCTLQAHRAYVDETVLPDGTKKFGTTMGTYDLGCAHSIEFYVKDTNQSNYYDKNGNASTTWYDEDWNTGTNNKGGRAGLWGIMGSNYSKNITYDHCTLNRIDAHSGVLNVTVKNNSNVVHVALTGGGTALIENSNIDNTHFVNLREDYGSTWRGTIKIINSTLTPKVADNPKNVYVITAQWQNHYFGYPCHLPNLVLDNVSVVGFDEIYILDDLASSTTIDLTPEDITDEMIPVNTNSDLDCIATENTWGVHTATNPNVYQLPTEIVIKNCKNLKFIGAYDGEMAKVIEALIKEEDE